MFSSQKSISRRPELPFAGRGDARRLQEETGQTQRRRRLWRRLWERKRARRDPKHSMSNAVRLKYQDVLTHPVTFCSVQSQQACLAAYPQSSAQRRTSQAELQIAYFCLKMCTTVSFVMTKQRIAVVCILLTTVRINRLKTWINFYLWEYP